MKDSQPIGPTVPAGQQWHAAAPPVGSVNCAQHPEYIGPVQLAV